MCETFRNDRCYARLFYKWGILFFSLKLEIAIATDVIVSKMTGNDEMRGAKMLGVLSKDAAMKGAKMMAVVSKDATMIGVLSAIAMSRDEGMNSVGVANRRIAVLVGRHCSLAQSYVVNWLHFRGLKWNSAFSYQDSLLAQLRIRVIDSDWECRLILMFRCIVEAYSHPVLHVCVKSQGCPTCRPVHLTISVSRDWF